MKTDLTDEQLRIAIAEWCGWRPSIVSNFPTQMLPPGETTVVCTIPKFTEDLNAMHSTEEKLTVHQRIQYQENLWRVVKPHPEIAHWHLIHATARQRALALYLTIKQPEPLNEGRMK